MNTWSNTVLTDKGLSLMAKLTQGNTLNITKAMTGAGFVTPGFLSKQTEVTDPKQTLRFKSVTYPEAGKCAIPVALKNEDLTTGYEATQVGLFAEDPDEGEILFLISQAAEEKSGTTIPSETEMPGYAAEWTFYLAYGRANGVSVTVDPANAVTRQEMEEHVDATFKEMKSDINMAGHKITNVGEPTDGTDVATRNFVEQHTLEGNLYVAVDYNNDGNIVLKPYVADEDEVTLHSHLANKENPHGVTPAQIGAAPSGYGYGEIPVSLGSTTDDAKFIVELNKQFDLTSSKTRQVRFTMGGVTYIGTLFNAGNGYGTLTANSYTDADTGALLTKIVRNRVNGNWQPWEYENPPLKNNTEYRTTERIGNKPVYVKRVDLGALPNKSNKREVIVPTGSTIVSIDGYSIYTSTAGNEIYTPLVNTEGVTGFFMNQTTGQVGINTDADLSTYTATVTVKYTK